MEDTYIHKIIKLCNLTRFIINNHESWVVRPQSQYQSHKLIKIETVSRRVAEDEEQVLV